MRRHLSGWRKPQVHDGGCKNTSKPILGKQAIKTADRFPSRSGAIKFFIFGIESSYREPVSRCQALAIVLQRAHTAEALLREAPSRGLVPVVCIRKPVVNHGPNSLKPDESGWDNSPVYFVIPHINAKNQKSRPG